MRPSQGLLHYAREPLSYAAGEILARDHEAGFPAGNGFMIYYFSAVKPRRVVHPLGEGQGHVDEVALGEVVEEGAYPRGYTLDCRDASVPGGLGVRGGRGRSILC